MRVLQELLLAQLVELLLAHDRHDGRALARLVHDGNEVLGEAERGVLPWSLKDVDKHVGECANQIIGRMLDALLMSLNRLDDLVEGDKGLDPLVEIATVL